METIVHLKTSELSSNFLKQLMILLGNDRNAEITISLKSAHPRVLQKETRKEYAANLDKAIENIEHNRIMVTLNGDALRVLTQKLLKK